MKTQIFKFFVVLFLIFGTSTVLAFYETTEGGQMSVEVSPSSPGPFTPLTINLNSFEIDLSQADIVWLVNGQKQKEGQGLTSIRLLTGEAGREALIEVTASSKDGQIIKKTIKIIPADLDITWESDSYVPPFYRGKALPNSLGTIKIVALPNFVDESGLKLSAAELLYSWDLGEDKTISGLGKNIVTTKLSKYPTNKMSVKVSTPDKQIVVSKVISVPPYSPKLLMYETKPLTGPVYQKSLGDSIVMRESETNIRLEPYFWDRQELSRSLEYSWLLNFERINSSPNGPNEIVLRRPNDSAGEAILSVSATDAIRSLQRLINIKFSAFSNF